MHLYSIEFSIFRLSSSPSFDTVPLRVLSTYDFPALLSCLVFTWQQRSQDPRQATHKTLHMWIGYQNEQLLLFFPKTKRFKKIVSKNN